MMESTICAIATAQGGAIGIVRISGNEAIAIASLIVNLKNGKALADIETQRLAFGNIIDGEGEMVDEVMVATYRAPHSYTGEDSVEIMAHGSPYILQRTLQLLIANGCQMASPGEYTQRAFLNGKMDLSQAEAVADLIASTSAATHKLALSQMRGSFSNRLKELRDQLLHISSLLELELDFSDHEELEFADRSELKALAVEIEQTISHLANSFSLGNAIKNGIPVAIVGETNAGKSTLLNALVGDDRAIVSDIHGTTRDVIEEVVNIDGIQFRFIDTAGIRHTADEIEAMGIERSKEKIAKSKIILWVVDASLSNDNHEDIKSLLSSCSSDQHIIVVFNKMDLTDKPNLSVVPERANHINISAKRPDDIERLKQMIVSEANLPSLKATDVVVTNARHYAALIQALEAIRRVGEGIDNCLSGDLVAEDLRLCLHYLNDIVGEVTSQDVLSNIFSHFCVGK